MLTDTYRKLLPTSNWKRIVILLGLSIWIAPFFLNLGSLLLSQNLASTYPSCSQTPHPSEGCFLEHFASVYNKGISIWWHIVPGLLALLFLGAQCWFLISRKIRPAAIHAAFGSVYGFCVFICATTGSFFALSALGGFVATVGYLCANALWLFCTVAGIRSARINKERHRRWMIRSGALALAAFTFRTELLFLKSWVSPAEVGMIVAWGCWIPNLIAAEAWIRSSHR